MPLKERECPYGCGAAYGIPTHVDELFELLDASTTADDERLMMRSLAAQAEGDAQTALDLCLQTAHMADTPFERQLRELIVMGDDACGRNQ